MTMRITITNQDTHRTAVAQLVDGHGTGGAREGVQSPNLVEGGYASESHEIAPGQSCDVWIHSGRRVVVHEKQEG